MQDFKRLAVWQKAHTLFLEVEKSITARDTRRMPWLRNQTLRAAASISANIAEGCGKRSTREFVRYIDIATGSATELENHLITARDVRVLTAARFHELEALVIEVRRMLIGLAKALRRQTPREQMPSGT